MTITLTGPTARPVRPRTPGRRVLGAVVRATVDPLPTCGCGQALETSSARHCPRCGVALTRGSRSATRHHTRGVGAPS